MAKGENPQKRSERYADELKKGKNSFTGKPLTAGQAGFRIGVLNERKWSGKIFKHKQKGTKSTRSKGAKNTNGKARKAQ